MVKSAIINNEYRKKKIFYPLVELFVFIRQTRHANKPQIQTYHIWNLIWS